MTHRGVLRSAYAIATGWDMTSAMPEDLDVSKMLILSLKDGVATIAQMNVTLDRR